MEPPLEPGDAKRELPRLVRWLVMGERVAGVGLLSAILGLMAAQVVARYVLKSPIPWSEELARFALIWLAFVAAASVMAEGRHITVDVISRFLGWRGCLVLEGLVSVVVLAVCVAFLPAGVEYLRQLGTVRSPALHIPMSWWYGAAVSGFVLLAAHTVINLVLALKRRSPLWRERGPGELEAGGGV